VRAGVTLDRQPGKALWRGWHMNGTLSQPTTWDTGILEERNASKNEGKL
jgi:hypothetical protein